MHDIKKHDALELEAKTFSKSERRCHRMHADSGLASRS